MYTTIKELVCELKQNLDKPRDARFELLCVIAMLLIVTCHVSMYLDPSCQKIVIIQAY